MKTVDEIVAIERAQDPDMFINSNSPYIQDMQRQIMEKGYFTAGLFQEEALQTPFLLLMHPLPFEGDRTMFHNHNCFEVAYVYHGACHNLRHGYEVTMHQGDLLLLNPLAIHCLHTDSREDVVFNFLIPESTVLQVFQGFQSDNAISDFFMDYLFHIRTGPDFLFIGGSENDALDPLVEQLIVEYYEKQPGYNTVLQTGLVQLFVYMARRCSHSIQALSLQNTSELVRKLILYIARNTATVTLSDAARAFSYHEKHISRQMKKELGLSFNQFLRHQRLRNAAQLLSHTDMPVSQIARDVGYQNVSYFYDLFEKQYAMTPAAWRASNRAI